MIKFEEYNALFKTGGLTYYIKPNKSTVVNSIEPLNATFMKGTSAD
jgi:hypothetical protein